MCVAVCAHFGIRKPSMIPRDKVPFSEKYPPGFLPGLIYSDSPTWKHMVQLNPGKILHDIDNSRMSRTVTKY